MGGEERAAEVSEKAGGRGGFSHGGERIEVMRKRKPGFAGKNNLKLKNWSFFLFGE